MNSIADMIGKGAGGGDDEPTGPALNEDAELQDEGGPMDVEAMRAQLDATDHPDSLRALGHSILDAHEAHVSKSMGGEPHEPAAPPMPEHRKPPASAHHRPSAAPERKPAKSGRGDDRRYDTSTNTYR